MAVISEIKDGGSVSFGQDGVQCTRIFFVTELVGAVTRRLYDAAFVSGVPRRGEAHPSIPSIIATSVQVEPIESGAKVTVNYQQPAYDAKEPDETEQAIIRVGSTVQEASTSRDKDGEVIKVKFTYVPVDEDGNQGEQITIDYVPVLLYQVASSTLDYQRRESRNPMQKSIKYTANVNKFDIAGFKARTLLCAGIDGESSDGGVSYLVTYRFQYNPDTWDAEFFYIDPETGQPHQDVTVQPANGYGTAKIYKELDFSALNVIR